MAEVVPGEEPGFYQIQDLWMYPWNDWFDGQTWKLTWGQDFLSPSVSKFRDQVKYVARVREVAVRTRIKGDSLYIQAYEIPD
jgi:hypothetical protein